VAQHRELDADLVSVFRSALASAGIVGAPSVVVEKVVESLSGEWQRGGCSPSFGGCSLKVQ
jgi:hypothetical protein